MKLCLICNKEVLTTSRALLCEKCKQDGYIICPICNEPHLGTWTGLGDKKICEDCHMINLGYKE